MLAACTTGVVQTDEVTYMIGRRTGQFGAGVPTKTQAHAYEDANTYCAKHGKSVKTIDLEVCNTVPFARRSAGAVEVCYLGVD